MSKRKLLLADDSITIQKVINLTFADEGIEVVTVSDGDSAIEKINEFRPDLVLADVHMPGLNGYEVCELVRATEDTRDLPVLLLVGSFEPFDENEAARVGANGHMTKPFQSIRSLVSTVTELMETSSAASSTTSDDSIGQNIGAGHRSELADRDGDAAIAIDSGIDASEPDPDGTNDIEELYRDSFTNAGETASEDGVSSKYVDAGMDDEMIEARYSDDLDIPEQHPVSYDLDSDSTGGASDVSIDDKHETSGGSVESKGAGVESSRDEFASTAAKTVEFEYPVSSQTTEQFDFDDLNLLELPPVRQAIEVVAPQEPLATPGTRQVVTLSPELMEMIVQQVIDRLSREKGS